METESSLRSASLALLADIAHYNLIEQTRQLERALLRYKAGFNPDQPRVPAGSANGGQWTSDSGAHSATQEYPVVYEGAPDLPIEPVYPIEEALGFLTVGQALIALRSVRLGRAALAESDRRIQNAMKAIEEYLGGRGIAFRNPRGDIVIMRNDRKVRFDINNTHRDKPHFHLQREAPNGKWRNAGKQHRYYFKEE